MPPVEEPGSSEPGLLTHDDSGTPRHPVPDDDVVHAESGYDDNPSRGNPDGRDGGKRGKAALSAKQRKRRRWRKIRRTLYALFGIFVVLPALAFTITYLVVDVPSPESVASQQNQVVTYKYSDGSLLGKVAPADGGNRVLLKEHQVPDLVKHAVYGAEDASFESNRGFDPTSILRAAWGQVSGGGGGGSTISQQYVKQATGNDEHSYLRKFTEVVKSFKMNNKQSKSEIITGYLNTVYFGRGAYGIQAAAHAYFDKDVDELSPSEAALLGGMIQQPSRYDDTDFMKQRWNYVLDQMVAHHWLPADNRKAAEFPDMIPVADAAPEGIKGPEAFIKHQVNKELKAAGYSEEKLQSEGYTVATTIDPKAQKKAEDAVTSVMGDQPDELSESLVAVDPQTGGVRAYYGGPNTENDHVDGAATGRNPGSAFKPFDLVALLRDGQGLAKTYDGTTDRKINGLGPFHNASPHSSCSEDCTVAQGMKVSANTVFLDMVINDVGPKAVADAAHQAGIPRKYGGDPTMDDGYNIAIGGGETQVTATMMASAYATFAADGVRHDSHFVSKVVDSDGSEVYSPDDEDESAFAPHNPDLSKKIAGNVTEALEPVLSFSDLSCPDGYSCAGKTGTHEAKGNKDANNQAWMAGYSPTISAASWVGTLKGGSEPITDSMGNPIFGADLPGAIWEKFMQSYLPGTPQRSFSDVDRIGDPLSDEDNDNDDGDSDDDSDGDSDHDSDHDGDHGDHGGWNPPTHSPGGTTEIEPPGNSDGPNTDPDSDSDSHGDNDDDGDNGDDDDGDDGFLRGQGQRQNEHRDETTE